MELTANITAGKFLINGAMYSIDRQPSPKGIWKVVFLEWQQADNIIIFCSDSDVKINIRFASPECARQVLQVTERLMANGEEVRLEVV